MIYGIYWRSKICGFKNLRLLLYILLAAGIELQHSRDELMIKCLILAVITVCDRYADF
jgi:hypothetical protein